MHGTSANMPQWNRYPISVGIREYEPWEGGKGYGRSSWSLALVRFSSALLAPDIVHHMAFDQYETLLRP